jgi:hypothetical protein
VLVPRRNIETWVVYLNGALVDEVHDYKPMVPSAGFKTAAQRLPQTCRAGAPAGEPASLRLACEELEPLAVQA